MNIKVLKFILIPLFLIILSGCPSEYRSNLVKVSSPSYFVLDKHLEYQFTKNILGTEQERTVKLKKGIYVATLENENGTFYSTGQNDYNFLYITKYNGKIPNPPMPGTGFHAGGLWISKENPPEAFPYYMIGEGKHYQEGLNYFDGTEIEVKESEGFIPHSDPGYIPGIGYDQPILDAAIAKGVIAALSTMDDGKLGMEHPMPEEVFKANIKVKYK